MVQRDATAERTRKTLAKIKFELRQRMHRPLGETGRWLQRVIRGWQNYYAIPFSTRRQTQFLRAVTRHWLGTIRRLSQKGRDCWSWFGYSVWHPRPRITHPHPFASDLRQEPYERVLHVRICAGAARKDSPYRDPLPHNIRMLTWRVEFLAYTSGYESSGLADVRLCPLAVD